MIGTVITYVLTTLIGMLMGFLVKSLTKKSKKEKAQHKALVALLRHEIVNVYVQHKESKTIPFFLKESVLIIYEVYRALGGNSFVEQLIREMKLWKVID